MRFSVITVCLNPGGKLNVTLDSVLGQSCQDAEVIVKDGGSRDGSLEEWKREHWPGEEAARKREGACQSPQEEVREREAAYSQQEEDDRREGSSADGNAVRVRIFVEPDQGIYDAMNQAVAHARGDFLVFLNCGDTFPDSGVLERVRQVIEEELAAGADPDALVLYGDTCSGKNQVTIASAPAITGFTCYRNIPCHQSCFYSRKLCLEKPYDLQYKIRADYDHFLWCFYRAGAKMRHMDFPVASYEGGGFSESRENRDRDRQEHRQITSAYMGRMELFRYRAAMALTLAPLRTRMAESRTFSGMYHWLKRRLYGR